MPSAAELVPPKPLRSVKLRSSDGADIRVRQHGNPDGPRLMLSHGNGFAIEGYYAFWRQFLDGFEVILHDLRNHGLNDFLGEAGHDYDGFVRDWEMLRSEVPSLFGSKPTAGLYHSASALTSLHHAHEHGWHWDALVLYDPPVMPAPGSPLWEQAQAFEYMMAGWAAERPDRFSDPEELAEAFRSTRSLAGWAPGTHSLIARATLREDPKTGDWRLSCPRDLESRVYAANANSTLWSKLPDLVGRRDKLLVLSSDPEARGAKSPSRVLPTLADEFGFEVRIVPGTGHLMQLEKPEAVARETLAFLSRHGIEAAAPRGGRLSA